jgi:hypothetical protein
MLKIPGYHFPVSGSRFQDLRATLRVAVPYSGFLLPVFRLLNRSGGGNKRNKMSKTALEYQKTTRLVSILPWIRPIGGKKGEFFIEFSHWWEKGRNASPKESFWRGTRTGFVFCYRHLPFVFLALSIPTTTHLKKSQLMPPGYSGTPLLKKLGITPSMKVQLLHAPAAYFDWLQTDIRPQLIAPGETPHFIHAFVTSSKEFIPLFKKLVVAYKGNPTVIIWISWYKKSAGMASDVTEDMIRNFALQTDLVDVKVCAVSEQWSGLKLVVRKERRGNMK